MSAAPNQQQTQNASTDEQQDAGATPPVTVDFDAWLNTQDEGTKKVIGERFTNLQSALESERQRNKTLGKELGALAKTAEAGSTLKTELDKMQAAIAKRDAELDFYKSAPDDVVNLRLAWLAATDLQLIDEKDNSVDWKALRTAQPLLFRKTASTNAGAGATQNGQGSVDMNALIRGSAGRR
jgi:hypothetical protein